LHAHDGRISRAKHRSLALEGAHTYGKATNCRLAAEEKVPPETLEEEGSEGGGEGVGTEDQQQTANQMSLKLKFTAGETSLNN